MREDARSLVARKEPKEVDFRSGSIGVGSIDWLVGGHRGDREQRWQGKGW